MENIRIGFSVVIYLKIVRRDVTPRNKAHVGGLVEEEREGPEKGARGQGRDQSLGTRGGGGAERRRWTRATF